MQKRVGGIMDGTCGKLLQGFFLSVIKKYIILFLLVLRKILNYLRSWQSLSCVWFLTKHSEAEIYNLFYHLNFMFSWILVFSRFPLIHVYFKECWSFYVLLALAGSASISHIWKVFWHKSQEEYRRQLDWQQD